tara:strand:+ start:380 stop:1222 length:843 start_codon:yes stop_codon:yes gene_type:complete
MERNFFYLLKNSLKIKQDKLIPPSLSRKKSKFSINERKGFQVVKESIIGKNIVIESKKLIDKIDFSDRIKHNNGKEYLITNNVNSSLINDYPDILKYALNESLILSISKYLGEIPVLRYIDVWYSKKQKSENYHGSQLFHCDWEDQRQIKVFTAISPINHKSGALNLIDAKTSDYIKNKLNYRYGKKLKDNYIYDLIEKSKLKTLSGDSGTMFICDTSRCFHYGSRINNKDENRLVAIFQFLRPSAIGMNKEYIRQLPFREINQSWMTEMQKFVLSGRNV